MKQTLFALLLILTLASGALAADTISAGVRAGATAGTSGFSTEVFADYHINRLFSVGATMGYVLLDHKNVSSARRDESMPVTALVKLRAPLPLLQPYVGVGQALIFRDKHASTGSPVVVAGLEYPLLPFVFLNVEYRRQFNDQLNFIAGGAGLRF
ncbi:outer membrane beta-barrel protein [Pelotalea chapellei]|uniref:Outer membrane beta-barrel protein n=1 Tax=Pelotalea chapellei TaxID=44671 RepID=A0ABS5UAL9_9BACT|nr:outer membrane beta-barrel protein [Pelotalea chapellei]MBT1072710.1 outer membrane beta-barrel protein [Pelotalea chapellei]